MLGHFIDMKYFKQHIQKSVRWGRGERMHIARLMGVEFQFTR